MNDDIYRRITNHVLANPLVVWSAVAVAVLVKTIVQW